MKQISRIRAKALMKRTRGEFFSVQFIKKDGTVRDMVCRLGVTKYLKGGELAFDPEEKGLMVVYEMNVEGYRMININSLRQLKIDGQIYRVIE